jgi:hypothetical protein
MKLPFVKSSLMLLSLSVVGCNTTTPGAGSSTSTATGAIVAQGNMPAYCQAAASRQYGASSVATNEPVSRGFGFLVTGTADTGQQTYIFNCRFNKSGGFLGISET